MAKRSVYNLPGLSAEDSPAPDLVKVGNLFFTSGVGGVDRKTGEMPEDPAEQFLNAWHNLADLVEGAGLSTDGIGLVTNFIDSQDYRPHINTGWLELFPDPDNRPARKTTAYPLPHGRGVELQAFGVVNGGKRQRIEVEGLTHRDPLPNGVRIGDYVFSSVIVPWDLRTSEPVVGEPAQTDQCFDNMRIFMELAGGSVDDVALQWVYLNDFAYRPYLLDVFREAWPAGQYQAALKTFRYPMGGHIQVQVLGKVGGNRQNFEVPSAPHDDPVPLGAKLGDLYCSSGVSGMAGGGPDGAASQAAQAMDNLQSLVQAGGGSLDDIGHLTVLIQDYKDMPAIDAAWKRAFPDPDNRPARQVLKLGIQGKMRVQYNMIAVV